MADNPFYVLNHEATDYGTAHTLLDNKLSDRLKHRPGLGWMVWGFRGQQWAPELYRSFMGEEAKEYRKVPMGAGAKVATRLENRGTLDNVMEFLREMPEFTANWNHNVNLIGVKNGKVNAKTLQFDKQHPWDFISENIDIEYHEDAKCPQFDKFVKDILPDIEVREYVQKLLGSGLLAFSPDQLFHIWKGEGANGKSLLQRVVQSVIGKMSGTVSTSLFIKTSDDSANKFSLSRVQNCRLIFSGEVPSGRVLEEYRIKQLTGEDMVVVEEKGQPHQEVRFFATFIMVVNEIPTLKQNTPAIKRRLRVIPFNVSFIGKQDSDLFNKLISEAEGILAWLIRGANMYLSTGLKLPKAIGENTEEAFKQSFVHTDALEEIIERDLTKKMREVTYDGIRDRIVDYNKKMGGTIKLDKYSLGQAIKVFMGDQFDVREGTKEGNKKKRYYVGWKYIDGEGLEIPQGIQESVEGMDLEP